MPDPMFVIVELVSVEKLRDGGSFAARLRADDGQAYELLFEVQFRAGEETQDAVVREFLGHAAPILGRVEEFGSVAAGHFGHQLKEVRQLSWEEALDLLMQARSLQPRLPAFRANDFAQMIAVAERLGARGAADPQFSTWQRAHRVER